MKSSRGHWAMFNRRRYVSPDPNDVREMSIMELCARSELSGKHGVYLYRGLRELIGEDQALWSTVRTIADIKRGDPVPDADELIRQVALRKAYEQGWRDRGESLGEPA